MTRDNTSQDGTNRRRFLKTTAALAGAGLSAGCLGGGGAGTPTARIETRIVEGEVRTVKVTPERTATPDLQTRAQNEGLVREATSITGVNEFYEQFEQDTGVAHDRFRSDATKVGTRILQEFQANSLSFDYQRAGDPQPALRLDEAGVYEEIPEVIQEEYPDRVFFKNQAIVDWYGLKLSLLYNKNMVSSPPSTIEELATDFAGQYAVDVRDEFIWVALKNEHGEERAKELVSMLGDGAVWKESHFTSAKNAAAGEVAMALTYNKFKYYEEVGGVLEEADLDDLPVVVREITSHILKDPAHPNAATLYMQYTAENVVDFLKGTGRPDAYFQPETVINSDDFYVWGIENIQDLDLEQAVEEWEQHTGLAG